MSDENTGTHPALKLLIGLGLIVLAIWIFGELTDLEEAGGTIRARIPAIIAIAYMVAGKWGVSGVIGLFGLGYTASGIGGLKTE